MIIVDIISGDEYEIDQESEDQMDRSQEEYQREIDNNIRNEQISRYKNDYLN